MLLRGGGRGGSTCVLSGLLWWFRRNQKDVSYFQRWGTVFKARLFEQLFSLRKWIGSNMYELCFESPWKIHSL